MDTLASQPLSDVCNLIIIFFYIFSTSSRSKGGAVGINDLLHVANYQTRFISSIPRGGHPFSFLLLLTVSATAIRTLSWLHRLYLNASHHTHRIPLTQATSKKDVQTRTVLCLELRHAQLVCDLPPSSLCPPE